MTANERTDAYALSFYKGNPSAAYIKQAKLITAGITNDYDKVKAIHDWVATNVYYDYWDDTMELNCSVAESNAELFTGSGAMKRGLCGTYAGVTEELMQAAGFPAKTISGGVSDGAHGWNEVYVDNRWVFVDTTWDSNNVFDGAFSKQAKCKQTYFDIPIAKWSTTHEVGPDIIDQDKTAWNGSLYIKKVGSNGAFQDKVLKEVKNFTVDGLVTSTYGYNATDMYKDAKCTIPWNFDTDKVTGNNHTIYVKLPTISVTFDTQGGTEIDAIEVKPDANGYCKIPTPATPTRDGYTFTGWVISNPNNSSVWDFNTYTISYDVTLYATWTKN